MRLLRPSGVCSLGVVSLPLALLYSLCIHLGDGSAVSELNSKGYRESRGQPARPHSVHYGMEGWEQREHGGVLGRVMKQLGSKTVAMWREGEC